MGVRRAAEPGYLDVAGPPRRTARKSAETLAFRIARDVIGADLADGSLLGSERELLARYGVSRAVFREAVRLLEYHSLVRTRTGPAGGIYVGRPDARAVTSATALFLEYSRIDPVDVYRTRAALESYAVRVVTENLDEAGRERLRASVDSELRFSSPGEFVANNDFHAVICDLSGNQVMRLFVDVCRALTASLGAGGSRDPVVFAAEVAGAHAGILEAMCLGDVALAQQRMDAHLRVWLAWIA
jgi:DNA-binding FadR family transcriptional regulator